jgi:phosphatidylserine/phosphatidylglycerophosphate/cardiolipin synthase-like enzyme
MSNTSVRLITEDIGSALSRLVARATGHLTVIAPFITQSALDRLLTEADPSLPLSVFTRWQLAEVVAGVSDLRVLDTVRARTGSRLLLHPRLHAKVILIDDSVAVLGSSNITDSALAFRDPPNVEIMAELRPVPNRLFLFIRYLERTSVPATDQLRCKLEDAARSAPPLPAYPQVEITVPKTDNVSSVFPSFRSPDRLYEGYLSVRTFRDLETRTAILDDLELLSLPEGLSENDFRKKVAEALLAQPLIAAFDEFVAEPRFFGEMVEWLGSQEQFTRQDTEQRKRYLQTLIRWLIYFLPARYRLREPGYSERFGRVDGWEE